MQWKKILISFFPDDFYVSEQLKNYDDVYKHCLKVINQHVKK